MRKRMACLSALFSDFQATERFVLIIDDEKDETRVELEAFVTTVKRRKGWNCLSEEQSTWLTEAEARAFKDENCVLLK